MAWPFSNVVQPNVDSGWVSLTSSYVAVPTTSSGTMWALGLVVSNPTSAEIAFSFEDSASVEIYKGVSIAAGAVVRLDVPFMPLAASPLWKGSGLVAKLWGYQ